MELLSVANLALVPVVVGLVQVVKGFINSKYAPLCSLVFGIGVSSVFPDSTVAETVLSGIVIGLAASGLYSGTKTLAQ
jgi:hypothetical protein